MKSKKRWFVTALTACLTLSLGICAEALEYDFDGVEDTEYYPSTSYESLYGANTIMAGAMQRTTSGRHYPMECPAIQVSDVWKRFDFLAW